VSIVVLCAADCPEVSPHGALAGGGVALCLEGLLVGGDLGEVALTRFHHRRHLGEAGAYGLLLGGEGRGALVGVRVAGVETLTAVGVLGRCRTVGSDEVVTVVVTVHFLGFEECALDVLDTCRADFCFCHSC